MINIKKLYKDAGALLEGHFLLSSKRHAQFYLQSAKVFEYPSMANELVRELSVNIKKINSDIKTICSPAIGGIIVGYELAKSINKRFIFTERVESKMTLRRGFKVRDGEPVVICEDIVTTGLSVFETYNVIKELGGKVVGIIAIANRGICAQMEHPKEVDKKECKLPTNIPFIALENFNFKNYDADECPLCKKNIKITKPGSR